MATIGKVSAVFTASTSGLRSGVNQATSSMSALERAARSTANGMRALVAIQGVQLFGNIASQVGSYVRSLVDMGRAQAEAIDTASEMAERLGLTFREFTGIADAAELAGVEIGSVASAITRSEVAFAKAAAGSKTAREAFATLGLSIEELNQMTPAERFSAIARAIAALPSEAQRAAAAVALFGRAGAQLLPLFSQGSAAIEQATAAADRFGRSLTNEQAANVNSMVDSFAMVRKAIEGVVRQVVANLAPAITGIATTFTDFVGSIGGANIGQAIGDAILGAARYMAQVGDYIISGIPKAFEYAEAVASVWSVVWEVGRRAFDYFAAVGRSIEFWFKGVGSVLTGLVGRLMNAAGELAQLVTGGALGKDLEKSGESLMRISSKLWDEAGQALEAYGENVANTIFGRGEMADAGEQLAGPLESALDSAIARADQAANNIDQAVAKPIEIKQAAVVDMAPVKKAVEGIDSRSSEGLKTMFRIMRGDTGNDVQEKQLRELERIADNTEDMDGGMADFDVVDLAPAAGA